MKKIILYFIILIFVFVLFKNKGLNTFLFLKNGYINDARKLNSLILNYSMSNNQYPESIDDLISFSQSTGFSIDVDNVVVKNGIGLKQINGIQIQYAYGLDGKDNNGEKLIYTEFNDGRVSYPYVRDFMCKGCDVVIAIQSRNCNESKIMPSIINTSVD